MTTEEKALELVAENRIVTLVSASGMDEVVIAGHHDHYYVVAARTGITCSCPSRLDYCSHALAAMIVWNDG